ncbi:uncharacterized protein [Engystomops pustulosus]|uniref:uncharacterized protein n=1 Tax=Engystomops pustulosus TaxID=76066 RepID=UPI003AFAB059
MDLLRKIDGLHVDNDTYLVTCDVESLYTCIKHHDGLNAVRYFLSMENVTQEFSSFILQLLEFVLFHNFFVFGGSFYLQLQGTAMGASCAPSYANLFLGLWERDLLDSDRDVAMDRVLFWARYIDDILIIWRGDLVELQSFFSTLNNNPYNIRLTYHADKTSVAFLDVTITKYTDGFLQTNVYRKETSVNSLLHATSSHPIQTVRAIPTGQFLRIRRICSSDDDFEIQADDLKNRFRQRGYSNRSLKLAYWRAKRTARQTLLSPKEKPAIPDQV